LKDQGIPAATSAQQASGPSGEKTAKLLTKCQTRTDWTRRRPKSPAIGIAGLAARQTIQNRGGTTCPQQLPEQEQMQFGRRVQKVAPWRFAWADWASKLHALKQKQGLQKMLHLAVAVSAAKRSRDPRSESRAFSSKSDPDGEEGQGRQAQEHRTEPKPLGSLQSSSYVTYVTYVCMYVSMYLFIYLSIYLFIYIYLSMYLCMYVCM
jgi:hypothetical protein